MFRRAPRSPAPALGFGSSREVPRDWVIAYARAGVGEDEMQVFEDRRRRGEAVGEELALLEALREVPTVKGYVLAPGADLRGANLLGLRLHGVDLRWANLRDANLHSADLTGADLRGADLTDAGLACARLTGAALFGATMTGTHLSRAEVTDVHGRKWRMCPSPLDRKNRRVLRRLGVIVGPSPRLGWDALAARYA